MMNSRGSLSIVDRCVSKYYRWASATFARRIVEVRCTPPIVSFSFDDFPHTTAAHGARVLEQLGVRGTFYVSFGLAEQPLSSGPAFTIDDVHQLLAGGHELGCHTYGHELAHRVPRRQYDSSIQRNEEALREVAPNYSWRSFAYPAGSVTPGAKRTIERRFQCGRGILPGINAGPTDINLLRANSLCSNLRPANEPISWIEKAVARHGWLIYFTHDVQDHPSRYGCTPDYLRAVARAAIDAGAKIMPIGEAMDRLTNGR